GYVRLLIEASRGSGGAERAPMRPAELCEQVLAEAAQIARARGVTLDAATDPAVAGAPEAPLDRTALARAAANLVANAAEHARSRVAVSCDVAGGYLVIEVADDGPGFSPAALERGCECLFTDDSSRSSRDGGRHYGLGLHAASEAASAHGGSVSLANSPSGGAVATIEVPLCGA
ncbi:ATP-binding protein, partial [Ellagibacter isourolithinifaciens]|uniref:ATP-binding protein n=1 Tax=Ellagibacter isourolithinifaciens TaxID=2137581 RepID=UPI003A9474DE